MKSISSKKVVKIGIVVDNIELASEYYAKIFGIEKPEVFLFDADKSAELYTWYKGSTKGPKLKVTKINTEPVYLELIEPLPDVANPFTDFKEKYGQGVFFISFYIEGFGEHVQFMENLGMPLTFKQDKGDERYAYFDTIEKLALTLELKEVKGMDRD